MPTKQIRSVKFTIEPTQTLDVLLHQVLNHALVSVNAPGGSLMLLDKKRAFLQIKARLGPPRCGRKSEVVYPVDEHSIAGWVVRHRRSCLCGDVQGDPRFAPSASGKNFSSLLSVPIIHKGKVVAVINADAPGKNRFSEKDKKQLHGIARKVAKPLADRISILDAMAQVSVELARSPQEGRVNDVLHKIADLAVRSLGADVVTLYQYSQDKDEFPVEGTGPTIAGKLNHPEFMRRRIFPGDVPRTTVKQHNSDFYPDAKKLDFLTGDVNRPAGEPRRQRFVERERIASLAALLLPYRAGENTNEEVVGVMFVNYRTHHTFDIDERSALATFADFAAAAILNARHEEKRRTEEVNMVETISANLAHLMKNVALAARIAAESLREKITDRRARSDIDEMERYAQVLFQFCDRIRELFKKHANLDVLDLRAIIEQVLAEFPSKKDCIAFRANIAADLPGVKSVDYQLRAVLHDIIDNAIDAMQDQPSGQLTIGAKLNRGKNYVEVRVSDTGHGVQEEIRERLFCPTVTTKKDSLGIGLWWSRTFMRAMGGDVKMEETTPGKGSTFLIEIPCPQLKDSRSPRRKREGVANDVLIVEDNRSALDKLLGKLRQHGYSVRGAASYADARHVLALSRFGLAVVDVRLTEADDADVSGLRLLTDIEREHPDLKVILISAYSHLDRIREQVEAATKRPNVIASIGKGQPGFLGTLLDVVEKNDPKKRGLPPAATSTSDQTVMGGNSGVLKAPTSGMLEGGVSRNRSPKKSHATKK